MDSWRVNSLGYGICNYLNKLNKMEEIELITEILNNRDLSFVEETKDQKSLAKEIHLRLGMYRLIESLTPDINKNKKEDV